MQIIYTLEKVTKKRIENFIFILIAAVLSLMVILFFCSFSNRLEHDLIGLADLVTCVLSVGLIWTVVAVFITMFNRIRGDGKESLIKDSGFTIHRSFLSFGPYLWRVL